MIELRNICKNYEMGNNTVEALKNVSVSFRRNEFVAILGPSGGGKTTMLNIIGGLDRYTSGDLIINGKSTVDFNDRDWDSYRNHTVGFIFQSYNLIPHQNVISNVELALTIAGISKKERIERAKQALERVGLGDQLYKKPNQLSGGQMQRVAIARALVNDPDILLADEPTGALDTQSSIQIMDLLKEVAADRLVVMVTHNPDLAEAYANRIVRLTDGQIISDTNPYINDEEERTYTIPKASMNIFTAFMLSLNNLMTKKARTILVSFAGSIGIIGIALIMSLSNGVNRYIDDVQRDSLSSYPLTIENSDMDMTTSMLNVVSSVAKTEREEGKVTEISMIASMFNQVGSNNLKAFKKYIENNYDQIDDYLVALQYSYGVTPNIYKADEPGKIIKVNPSTIYNSMFSSSMRMYTRSAFQQLLDNRELLESQYDLIEGRWPEKYDEMVLIVNSRTVITDYIVYALGLRDPGELEDFINKMMQGEKAELNNKPMSFTWEDFLKLEYKLIIPADFYEYDRTYDVWKDMSDDKAYMQNLLNKATTLKITGIIIPREGRNNNVMMPGVGYLPSLTEYVIEQSHDREIVKQQLADKERDVFSRRTFEDINSDNRQESNISFDDMISVDTDMMNQAFRINVNPDDVTSSMNYFMSRAMNDVINDAGDAGKQLGGFIRNMAAEMLADYINQAGEGGTAVIDMEAIDRMIDDQMAKESSKKEMAQIEKDFGLEAGYMEKVLRPMLKSTVASYVEIGKQFMPSGDTPLSTDQIVELVNALMNNPAMEETIKNVTTSLLQGRIMKTLNGTMSEMGSYLSGVMNNAFIFDASALQNAFKFNMTEEEITRLMMTYMNTSQSDVTADGNLRNLGYVDPQSPVAIAAYLKDFDSKEGFKKFISDYNDDLKEKGHDEDVIVYTDITGILISSVSNIINAISYVLIAFVSVSLIVSSIMIAIITYISVLERTKEIGVLRSLGASKGNVASVFNAETFIIGLFAGTIGVITTVLLCYPINWIVRKVTDIPTLTAYLPLRTGLILIVISIVLTVIAGIIPSRMAMKCDPVTALRTE